MNKIAVIYWSGTGNTQAMANAVAEGARAAGAEADLFSVSEFDASRTAEYTGFAFGCPAMGSEQLEDSEFEPLWDSLKNDLADKKVVLFGSYGWGGGEWMNTWESEAPCPILKTFVCNDSPDSDAEASCKELGAAVAQ